MPSHQQNHNIEADPWGWLPFPPQEQTMSATRLNHDGPHVTQVHAWITKLSLMDAIAAIRDGEWPLSEFSEFDARQLEVVAKLIRENCKVRGEAERNQ